MLLLFFLCIFRLVGLYINIRGVQSWSLSTTILHVISSSAPTHDINRSVINRLLVSFYIFHNFIAFLLTISFKKKLYSLKRMVPCVDLAFTVKRRVVSLAPETRLSLSSEGCGMTPRGCSSKYEVPSKEGMYTVVARNRH